MSSTSNFYAIPPPPLTIIGGTTETVTVTQPQIYNDVNDKQGISSSSSSTSSIIIVIIVIASAIIVSASVYLLLRLISRRFHRSFRTFSAVDDVIPRHEAQTSLSLFTSLPLFTFGSVNGKVNGGDCAVCLSKFELEDQLRLLPVCCHAFHARCIDTWLESNQTCPLCRSTVFNTDADVLNKALSASATENGNVSGNNNNSNSNGNSFRLEIGSISRRRAPSASDQGQRSYSIGSFDYIVDDGYEVSVSDCTSVDKDSTGVNAPAIASATQTEPPGDSLAAEVSSSRSWLREYVDRALSFRSSGRYFTGSSRRTDGIVMEDLEANRIGDEIGELFRWFSGV